MFNIQIFVITTERCKQHQCQASDLLAPVFVWWFREHSPGGLVWARDTPEAKSSSSSQHLPRYGKTQSSRLWPSLALSPPWNFNFWWSLNLHPGVIFVSLGWRIGILHGKMLNLPWDASVLHKSSEVLTTLVPSFSLQTQQLEEVFVWGFLMIFLQSLVIRKRVGMKASNSARFWPKPLGQQGCGCPSHLNSF